MLLSLPVELLGQPGAYTSCCQLRRPPQVFFRNKQACPLTADPDVGEWLDLQPTSSPLAVVCPEPSPDCRTQVSSNSRPALCLHTSVSKACSLPWSGSLANMHCTAWHRCRDASWKKEVCIDFSK